MIEFKGCSTCDNTYQKVVLVVDGRNYCQECDLAGKWKKTVTVKTEEIARLKKENSEQKVFNALIRASQVLNPWYTIDLSFENGLISISIYSTVNRFCLVWVDYTADFEEALSLLTKQLLVDSLPNGRYADNQAFMEMFGKAAFELKTVVQNSKELS